MSARRAVLDAIGAVKRGRPVAVGGWALLAVETAGAEAHGEFGVDADLLVSGRRAALLKLANQRAAAVPGAPVRIAHAPWLDLGTARAVADPVRDLATPLKGPFEAREIGDEEAARAGLRLALLSGLLPALFVRGRREGDPAPLAARDVLDFDPAANLGIAARARLPTRHGDRGEIVAFRSGDDAAEHVALVIGAPREGEPPLVRLHSECLTGDALGSLKCDCGAQLEDALCRIAAAGWGVLVYLRQEGRGIGLVNKIRAYALQDQGHDTVDANHRLGFADDERDYAVAAAMLKLLGRDSVRLLTNNPAKAEALAAAGIEIVERIPLRPPATAHSRAYLDAKRDRSGHQL
ncbi:MAG: GTP cyclohydrolase II [Sphingomonadaceae bacterium]